MRGREPDADRFVDQDGVKIHWEVFGDGETTLLLLPVWTILHARLWKAQVPYLARHFRVVTYDGPGNGRSERPLHPAPYGYEAEGRSAVAVLDATGTERAVLVSLSMGAQWALWVTAHHPGRVLGNVFIGPGLDLGSWEEDVVPPFDEPYTTTAGWAKYNQHYWQEHWRDFLEFFFSQCFTEPHSTKQVEDSVGWGLETTPQVLIAVEHAPKPDETPIRDWCARVRRPVLVIHGSEDGICPLSSGEALASTTGGRQVVMEGAGHIPNARDPVKVNQLITAFARSLPAPEPR